jgi:hypothetical protein
MKLFGVQRRRETNSWSWWKQCLTVVETQGCDQQVWGITKEIHWTQESTISWSWWCSLHVLLREMQDWNKLYCTVLTARTEALSFFQNSALDRECNPHAILIHNWY